MTQDEEYFPSFYHCHNKYRNYGKGSVNMNTQQDKAKYFVDAYMQISNQIDINYIWYIRSNAIWQSTQ